MQKICQYQQSFSFFLVQSFIPPKNIFS